MTTDRTPRRAGPESAVSVIVPCFNHGVFLEECLASVETQTRPAAEVIVVDDGSTDAYTIEVLDRVEGAGRARVVRQANSGPSAARNRAVEASTGELVLPLDADNRLGPRALEAMKAALLAAPDLVRWVYPHQSFFGSRDDLVTMPEFNLWLLLTRNFCDTGSLIDRSVFDAGCRYREDIGLGHEDWDFFLGAVERGFVGAPCHERVFFVRKHGFTRSDLVDHQFGSFAAEMRRLRPALFSAGNMLRVKQEWAPALSLVVDGAAGPGRALLDSQTFQDFELVAARRRDGRFVAGESDGDHDDGSGARSTVDLLGRAKGRWVLLWSSAHLAALADPAFLEKAVTVGEHSQPPTAVALVAAASDAAYGWRRAAPDASKTCIGVLAAGHLLAELLPSLQPDGERTPIEQVLDAMDDRTSVEWRSVRSTATACTPPRPRAGPRAASDPTGGGRVDDKATTAGDPEVAEESRRLEREFRQHEASALHLGNEPVTRPPRPPRDSERDGWNALLNGAWAEWAPAHTRPLVLSFDPIGFRWQLDVGSDDPRAAHGRYPVRIPLGRVYTQSFPGTVSLWSVLSPQTGTFSYRLGDPPSPQWCIPLGFVSTAHLPGMVNLAAEVASRLERLRAHTGGRPLAPFSLGGEEAAACIEAFHPPPAAADDRSTIAWPRWPVYEAASPDGRVTYSTHPDAPAVLAGGALRRATTVARVMAPGRTANVLVEAVVDASGARMYVNHPPNPLTHGVSVSDALGSLLDGQEDVFPLVRLAAVTPGPHSAVPEPGHRVRAYGWEPFVEAGTHQPEGILGGAYAPAPERAPLYRWRHAERNEWRFTLGCGVGDAGGAWRLEGTIGLAFAPTVDWWSLIDFLELRHPVTGRVAYACDGSPEARTHRVVGVVARLYRAHEGGTVPLFRLRGPQGEAVHGVNPEELAAAGFRGEGPVAHVGVAVPPSSPRQPTRSGGGVRRVVVGVGHHAVDGVAAEAAVPGFLALVDKGGAVAVTAVPPDGAPILGWAAPGPFPWSMPLYELVERHTGARVVSTDGDLALAPTHGILRVVGYLGSPSRGVDASAMAASVRLPAPARPALPGLTPELERSARRVVAELPPSAQRALRSTWHAVQRIRP